MSKEHKYIELKEEIAPYEKILALASDRILDHEVSNYPVFIFHQLELAMGLPLWEEGNEPGRWKVHASSLEEFVTKQLIDMNKVDEFLQVYKDPTEHFCLFVISELGANFIFVPRNKEQ